MGKEIKRGIERRKELAIEATKEVGKILMDDFGRSIKTKWKNAGLPKGKIESQITRLLEVR